MTDAYELLLKVFYSKVLKSKILANVDELLRKLDFP